MNRFDETAARIQSRWSVHVEWAPVNREYVVDGHPISGARAAERLAKLISIDLDPRRRSENGLSTHAVRY